MYRDISHERHLVEGIGGVKLPTAGIGHIMIKIWNNGDYTFDVFKGVIHVHGLGRNFFYICFRSMEAVYSSHN